MSTNGRNFLNTNLVKNNRHHTQKPSNSPFKIKTKEKTRIQEVFFTEMYFFYLHFIKQARLSFQHTNFEF